MGGILWRLAMESTENFDQIISEIMDGPGELGPNSGDYFYVDGLRYYDLVVSSLVSDTMCGVRGLSTRRFESTGSMYIYIVLNY